MTRQEISSNSPGTRGQVLLECILLALCLCVIAIRTTYTESPTAQTATLPINLGDNFYTLLISTLLVLAFVVWVTSAFVRKSFSYRPCATEIGLGIFIIAAAIAGIFAANKRSAITEFVMLLAPVLMAILLVQMLDSPAKIKLVLCTIAALGAVSAYKCAEQRFLGNQRDITQYERDPNSMLGPLGIKPGSFNQMLLEHRLYSKDVRGFFTTSNSAGSFTLLAAFAAAGLFIDKLKNRKSGRLHLIWLIGCGVAVTTIVFGLVITRSKGAITASLIAAIMFAAFLLFGKWLGGHKKAVLIVCILLMLLGGCAVVLYGLTHDSLPGGNSMLVRWQYWTAAARMYADHPLTGVGGGNFTGFYPRYKNPAALETVSDPHNLALTILTQYGPLGLVGFLAMIFVPLYRSVFTAAKSPLPKGHAPEPGFMVLAAAFVIIFAIMLPGNLPGIIFAAAFLLLAAGLKPAPTDNMNITIAALFCAIVGCLVHNLIDYAIFEPGVYTTFWAITACLVALDAYKCSRPQIVLKPAFPTRFITIAAAVALFWLLFNFALAPAVDDPQMQQAMTSNYRGHDILDRMAKDDPLDPTPLSLNGRLYLRHYQMTERKQPHLLERAVECFRSAATRDRADYKNFSGLTTAYLLLAENSTAPKKTKWLTKALDSANSAVERYPGAARLRIELAKIAEQLGKTNIALKHYKKAITIEHAYRRQFRRMFPNSELVSRLGNEKYNFAKQRVKELSK